MLDREEFRGIVNTCRSLMPPSDLENSTEAILPPDDDALYDLISK